MARYKLNFKKPVAKDLRPIPNQDVQRLLAQIDLFAGQSSGKACIKLSGQNCYRTREGLYRTVHEILDDRLVVQVVKVASRGNVY